MSKDPRLKLLRGEEEQTASGSFTVDSENTQTKEMPSITKLLNRRRFDPGKSKEPEPKSPKSSKTPPKDPDFEPSIDFPPRYSSTSDQPTDELSLPTQKEPIITGSITPERDEDNEATLVGPSIQPPPIPASKPAARKPPPSPPADPAVQVQASVPISEPPVRTAEVQRAQRRERKPSEKLVIWDGASLSASNDPLAQALSHLLARGPISALFLRIGAPEPGKKVPLFIAKAIVNSKDRAQIWTGLKWDPSLVSDMWKHFVREGFIELPPPATSTNERSNRNMVRGAFGLNRSEWFTMVRVGPANACRGVVTIVSSDSLRPDLDKLLSLFHSSVASSAA